MKDDKSLNMSLPRETTMHGVVVRKLTNGKYLRLLQILQDFPKEVLGALYPDKTAEEALEEMGEITFDKVVDLIPKLMTLLPDKTFDVLSELLEVDRTVLENELDPLDTIEILEELGRLNRFDELKKKLRPYLMKIPVLNRIMTIGSNI